MIYFNSCMVGFEWKIFQQLFLQFLFRQDAWDTATIITFIFKKEAAAKSSTLEYSKTKSSRDWKEL